MPISETNMQFFEYDAFRRCRHSNKQNIIRLLGDKRTKFGIPNNDGHKYEDYPYMHPIKTNQDYSEWFIGKYHNRIFEVLSDGRGYTVNEIIERIDETVCRANHILDLDFRTIRKFLNESGVKKVDKNKLEQKGMYIDDYYYIKK